MAKKFRWNEWNVEHIAKHGVTTTEAEYIVSHPDRGYPQEQEDGKYLAIGQTFAGTFMQVIYVFDPPFVVYVIHARLTDDEKRRLRKKRRKRGS